MAGKTDRDNIKVSVPAPWKRTAGLFFLAALTWGAAAESRADFYRYIDDDGAVCFTDAPAKKGAVRIMREHKEHRRQTPRNPSPVKTDPAAARDSAGRKWSKGMLEGATLPVPGRISSSVGLRHDPIDGLLRYHNGIDIAVAEGTPVKPVSPGTVQFSGNRNGYGNMVIVSHDDGMMTIYAHNSMNLVREGERVARETSIAFSGSTGRSTGPHLHFEAWKDGINMTDEVVCGLTPGGKPTVMAHHRRRETIRRSIMADGSLLFTNLP